ncbi:HAMP domain-containing histidine kinase [Methylosinus sp. LW4]|uniref:HAMP domain-containing histidine kinase n=1 Tax=Methylosinus sp. LW4 TaxID=136993 RepID=UPI00035C54D7|nr:HAMP domain-containing histidine kinase [Methylosinus sp. LW4]
MKLTQSIKFRMVASLWLLFATIAGIGIFGLGRLEDVNRESSDIRERWLKSTRYIGDLDNFTSDFRAAEGAFLIAAKDVDAIAIEREMESLDEAISKAQKGYESILHDEIESADYRIFEKSWNSYRAEAKHTLEIMTKGDKAAAGSLFMSASRVAFASTSEALGRLSDRTNTQARLASERYDHAIREARALIIAAAILGASMALGIMLYVTRQITDPLLELAASMRRLSRNETDIQIYNTERPDELGEMARSVVVFRENAIQLQVSQQALATEASMLEEKLEHERRLGENQRNFISMASHEFRTPMTIIDGHAQRLLNARPAPRNEVIIERANKIRAAVRRMSIMIEGLLQTSRVVESPRLYFHPTNLDMSVVLKEVCDLHREISSNASVIEKYGAEKLPFYGDRNLISQVFSNLIGNAIKYSSPGGAVRVVVRSRRTALQVFVSDRGIGIPRRDVDHIFSRYYRASNASGITGTGVGLYLAKVVVELHGGVIKVKSREGKGSIFFVSLPFEAAGRAR